MATVNSIPKKSDLITEILNSEGTILALYRLDNQLVLGSNLSDGTGMVYYSTTREKLMEYLQGTITLKNLCLASEDFLVTKNMRQENSLYLKQDIAEHIQCGNEYYPTLSEGLKIPRVMEITDSL